MKLKDYTIVMSCTLRSSSGRIGGRGGKLVRLKGLVDIYSAGYALPLSGPQLAPHTRSCTLLQEEGPQAVAIETLLIWTCKHRHVYRVQRLQRLAEMHDCRWTIGQECPQEKAPWCFFVFTYPHGKYAAAQACVGSMGSMGSTGSTM